MPPVQKAALCKGLPVCIDILAFIREVAEGDFPGPHGRSRSRTCPAICGRVCPQETQCEGACVLGIKETPIRIGALERFVADWERQNGAELPKTARPTGKRVAVVDPARQG